MQEATSSIVVESTMWMVARKRWRGPLERFEPANPGEVGHALGAPLHVVGEEFHFALFAVDLHQGHDSSEF
jgi:hypothetical protein